MCLGFLSNKIWCKCVHREVIGSVRATFFFSILGSSAPWRPLLWRHMCRGQLRSLFWRLRSTNSMLSKILHWCSWLAEQNLWTWLCLGMQGGNKGWGTCFLHIFISVLGCFSFHSTLLLVVCLHFHFAYYLSPLGFIRICIFNFFCLLALLLSQSIIHLFK